MWGLGCCCCCCWWAAFGFAPEILAEVGWFEVASGLDDAAAVAAGEGRSSSTSSSALITCGSLASDRCRTAQLAARRPTISASLENFAKTLLLLNRLPRRLDFASSRGNSLAGILKVLLTGASACEQTEIQASTAAVGAGGADIFISSSYVSPRKSAHSNWEIGFCGVHLRQRRPLRLSRVWLAVDE